jgi:hypothetical protein
MPTLKQQLVQTGTFNTSFTNNTQTVYTTTANQYLIGSFSQASTNISMFYSVGANKITNNLPTNGGGIFAGIFGGVSIPLVIGPSQSFSVTRASGSGVTTTISSNLFTFSSQPVLGIDAVQDSNIVSPIVINTTSAYTVPAGKRAVIIAYAFFNVIFPASNGPPPDQATCEATVIIRKNGVNQAKTTAGYYGFTQPLFISTASLSTFVNFGTLNAGDAITFAGTSSNTIVGYEYTNATIF